MHKLNSVVHDPQTRTVLIILRPRTQRRPSSAVECPGKVVLDIDEEGDVWGVRLLDIEPAEARALLETMGRAGPRAAGDAARDGA